jgi:hypothetical protein
MASLIEGYNYDIFISYRQKDNKYDGWVTEFVDNLKKELEATFKEDISVYFDINPHDGLLESHEVDDSLKEKLKCLVFVPIISRTYCDPKSFAWEKEFKVFLELAANDKYGIKIKLPNGNVALRILPIRINDLNKEDINLCESVLGGVLRGIEFIYRSPGVNRPLRASEDHVQDNLNKTYYRDQINKVSHSIQEIIIGLKSQKVSKEQEVLVDKESQDKINLRTKKIRRQQGKKLSKRKVIISSIICIATFIAFLLMYPMLFNRALIKKLNSEEMFNKAINNCDIYKYWSNYTGKIRNIHRRIDSEYIHDEKIEIQTKENFYRRTWSDDTNQIVFGIKDGKYFREVNGVSNPSVDLIKKYGLSDLDIHWWKEYHYCHFGLLMQVKSSGLKLNKKVKITKFQGDKHYELSFTYDSTKIKNDFFKNSFFDLYLDMKDNSLRGFKSNIFGQTGSVVCIGNQRMNGINIPIERLYLMPNNSFVALDLFTILK